MKLKTLKDLESDDGEKIEDFEGAEDESPFVSVYEITQEAIKWIKELEKARDNPQDNMSVGGFDLIVHPSWGRADIQLLKEFLKHFFNITEEDLK